MTPVVWIPARIRQAGVIRQPRGRSISVANPYIYNAEVVRVIDGDTLVLQVDLGFNVWLRHQTFRLLGINSRELAQAGGKEAKANLEQLAPPGSRVQIASVKNDKYGGRFDAIVSLADGEDLSALLVETGWAAAWNGAGTKKNPPWPRAQ